MLTVNFTVDVPAPGAAKEEGLKLAVTPEGRLDADNSTAALKPPATVVVTVEVPLLPGATDTEVGDTETAKLGVTVTVRLTVAVCVMPPPVPVIVIGYVPVAAVVPTVRVTVDVPEPGAAMDVGLKLTVTPVGWPDADNPMAELKEPDTAVVMTDVPLLPCATETAFGEAEMLKFAGPVTTRLTVVVCVTPPPTAVMVIGYVPAEVFEATVRLRTELPVPGAAMLPELLKPRVTPEGRVAGPVKVIVASKPFRAVVEIVDVPTLPCTTVSDDGEEDREKPATGGPARALIRAAPFMLPHPVAKS